MLDLPTFFKILIDIVFIRLCPIETDKGFLKK